MKCLNEDKHIIYASFNIDTNQLRNKWYKNKEMSNSLVIRINILEIFVVRIYEVVIFPFIKVAWHLHMLDKLSAHF